MKILAVVAVLGLSLTLTGAQDDAAGKKAPAAGVPFSVFVMTNTQGIPMKVTLEAPPGKIVYGPAEVPADGSVSIDPKAGNVSAARVVADYGKDHGRYEQTVSLNGKPNELYIKTLMASGGIGSVRVTDLAGSHP